MNVPINSQHFALSEYSTRSSQSSTSAHNCTSPGGVVGVRVDVFLSATGHRVQCSLEMLYTTKSFVYLAVFPFSQVTCIALPHPDPLPTTPSFYLPQPESAAAAKSERDLRKRISAVTAYKKEETWVLGETEEQNRQENTCKEENEGSQIPEPLIYTEAADCGLSKESKVVQ
ncbi:MAG: hypothetical protein CYPHOPRED_003089 [Cyphobasidiales sp. Tagirdzhanova-0007]|nr:MAG: hypothetical protein CYPHOPRED_003089 [Cyphobasidiales sp. Tagirdzhanova-0007]